MPQVTLLGAEGTTYTLFSGLVEYFFENGVPQKVPVSVALEAQKKTKGNNKKVFTILGLPNIVGSCDDPLVKEVAVKQNVDRELTNLRFETWL